MIENAVFPKIEDVRNLMNGTKQLVKTANVVDILSTYASNCSKQISDFCIDRAIRKKTKDIDILSSLPAPIEMNLTNETPDLKKNTTLNEYKNSDKMNQQPSLVTSYPVVSIAKSWSQANFLAGSLNNAFYFPIESFFNQKISNQDENQNIETDFHSNQLSTTFFPPGNQMSFCRNACFHPSDALCAISKDNSIYLYDISSQYVRNENTNDHVITKHKLKLISSLLNTHKSCITGLTFSPDGSHFASSSLDSSIKTYDLVRSETIYNINTKKKITYLDSSLNGQFIGATTDTGNLILFDDRQEGSTASISAHKYRASTLSFNTDSQYIATAGSDKSVALFDIRQPISSVFRLYKHYGTPISICFDNFGNLWSSTTDGELQAWNMSNARNVFSTQLTRSDEEEKSQSNSIFKILFIGTTNSILYSIGHGELRLMELNDETFNNNEQTLFNFA
ncbi:hypothetical protein M9Y10_044002 [Tritrichomonas musculus]|uniref:Anaphase-promoting complex subunit 4 WD40 domain-containing protein n=1 Tax=Tritrichomonas musculus TaxID=1915356 RepID=A0ABR2K1N2_9EUKA